MTSGEIIGENQDGIGIDVTDNNEILHEISINKDGWAIVYHNQDGYADEPENRTIEESEYGSQARRYAKWHVYRERGYDTVPPTSNPDRIAAALSAVASLSDAEFTKLFGELQEQIESHGDGRTVELPFDDVDPDDPLIYSKDIYLRQDPTELDPPVLEQFLGRFEGDSDSPAIPDKETLDTDTFDALDFDIEAVSGLHYLHNDGLGSEQTVRGEDPLEREPDATVELMAFDPDEIDSFHHYVVSHLAYQIRDCFLLMGLKPPVAFRAQGWGKYDGFTNQKFCPQYQNYWSSEATITSWQPE